jgi:prepilin-type processing-associated H-X9-DG protein
MPALQKVREVAMRTRCANNLKQIGIALHMYVEQYAMFPSGGEGTDSTTSPASSTFNTHSTFTRLLVYIECEDIYNYFNLNYAYNDNTNAPVNVAASKYDVSTFLCPSNPLRGGATIDAYGYGYVDYMPTTYTDIDPIGASAMLIKNPASRAEGMLRLNGTRIEEISDGLSSTVCMAECVGRSEKFMGVHADPIGYELLPPGSTYRCSWRWADPDSGSGISGPPGATFGTAGVRGINNNKRPFGGPPTCPWTTWKCGPNDEIFSFHGQGANFLFGDGHVNYLLENVDLVTLRQLITASEGTSISSGVDY